MSPPYGDDVGRTSWTRARPAKGGRRDPSRESAPPCPVDDVAGPGGCGVDREVAFGVRNGGGEVCEAVDEALASEVVQGTRSHLDQSLDKETKKDACARRTWELTALRLLAQLPSENSVRQTSVTSSKQPGKPVQKTCAPSPPLSPPAR